MKNCILIKKCPYATKLMYFIIKMRAVLFVYISENKRQEVLNMVDRHNLIFIMTDHQRADSIGMIQDGKEVTPNLNKFAKQSVRFTRAYNTCPLCVPARTAIATGENPISNGVVLNKGQRAKNCKTIHEYLYEAGYRVGHVGIHHIMLEPDLKDRIKFTTWVDDNSYFEYAADRGIDMKRSSLDEREIEELHGCKYEKKRYSNARTSVWSYTLESFKDNYFCSNAVEFIKQNYNKDQPFALFLYFWAPHPPLKVPEPYASKFDPLNLNLPQNVGKFSKNLPLSRFKSVPVQLAQGLTMEEWRNVWAAHLGLVNLADEAIGRILKTVEQMGIDDDTMILFTVDHGDHLGQHNMYQKMEMYEQAIRIPLLFKVPGVAPKEFDMLVSHLDILPSILDLLNIEVTHPFEGVSLKHAIIDGISSGDRYIYCQYSGNPQIGDIRRAVITQQYKYIYDGTIYRELYNLKTDPLEMNNLADEPNYRDIINKLHQQCKNWGERSGDWVDY